MERFRYYIIFNSSGTLDGTWTGTIEEFSSKFITNNINDIYTYQIWVDNQDEPDMDNVVEQKLDQDIFDQMIEAHEQEQLEQQVSKQWAKEQYLREFYSQNGGPKDH